MSPDLLKRYRWFRENGSSAIVGHSAECALSLARAEQTAERRGLRVVWEEEDESYESVYGEPLPENVYGPFWVWVPHPDERKRGTRRGTGPMGTRPIASLGMVTLARQRFYEQRDPYARFVAAELFSEALDVLDEEDAQAASVLAQRATYAGVSP